MEPKIKELLEEILDLSAPDWEDTDDAHQLLRLLSKINLKVRKALQ